MSVYIKILKEVEIKYAKNNILQIYYLYKFDFVKILLHSVNNRIEYW